MNTVHAWENFSLWHFFATDWNWAYMLIFGGVLEFSNRRK